MNLFANIKEILFLKSLRAKNVYKSFGSLGASLLISCSVPEPPLSDVSQLTDKDFPCIDYPENQIEMYLNDIPEKFIVSSSFRVGRVEEVKNQLTGIPKQILNRLYETHRQNGFFIAEQSLRGSTIGETLLVGQRGRALEPVRIFLTARPDAVRFALQHEVGHAAEGYIRQGSQASQQDWLQVFNEGRSHPRLRSYAKSSPGEYFAEAFANYYCSQVSHNFIRDELPNTYAQLRRMLPTPSWENGLVSDSNTLPKGDVFLLIDDENPDEIHLYVSAKNDVNDLKACLLEGEVQNAGEECSSSKNSLQNEVTFEKTDLKIGERIIFRTIKPVDFEKNSKFSILTYKENTGTSKLRAATKNTYRFKSKL